MVLSEAYEKWLRTKNSVSLQQRVLRFLQWAVIAVGALLFILPLVWTLSGSLKPSGEIFTIPVQWIPSEVQWSNYVELFQKVPMLLYIRNTLIVVTLAVIGQFSSLLVAYGFARFRHPWRNTIFILVLATLMLPEQVTMIPQFLMYKTFGWLDTFLPLIAYNYFGTAYNIFLFRQFIMGIPRDLDESAKIDGAGTFAILMRIILPMCSPIIFTVIFLTVNFNWNDFLYPLIYLNSPENYTLQIGIYNLKGGDFGVTDYGMLFAAIMVALLPNFLLFLFGQRYFLKGIRITGSIKS